MKTYNLDFITKVEELIIELANKSGLVNLTECGGLYTATDFQGREHRLAIPRVNILSTERISDINYRYIEISHQGNIYHGIAKAVINQSGNVQIMQWDDVFLGSMGYKVDNMPPRTWFPFQTLQMHINSIVSDLGRWQDILLENRTPLPLVDLTKVYEEAFDELENLPVLPIAQSKAGVGLIVDRNSDGNLFIPEYLRGTEEYKQLRKRLSFQRYNLKTFRNVRTLIINLEVDGVDILDQGVILNQPLQYMQPFRKVYLDKEEALCNTGDGIVTKVPVTRGGSVVATGYKVSKMIPIETSVGTKMASDGAPKGVIIFQNRRGDMPFARADVNGEEVIFHLIRSGVDDAKRGVDHSKAILLNEVLIRKDLLDTLIGFSPRFLTTQDGYYICPFGTLYCIETWGVMPQTNETVSSIMKGRSMQKEVITQWLGDSLICPDLNTEEFIDGWENPLLISLLNSVS